MSEKFVLKTTVTGGFKKTEVLEYVNRVTALTEELESKVEQLEKENHTLIEKNRKQLAKLEEYNNRKDALLRLEMDARHRVDEMIQKANHKAEQIIADAEMKSKSIYEAREKNVMELKAKYGDEVNKMNAYGEKMREIIEMMSVKNNEILDMIQEEEVFAAGSQESIQTKKKIEKKE